MNTAAAIQVIPAKDEFVFSVKDQEVVTNERSVRETPPLNAPYQDCLSVTGILRDADINYQEIVLYIPKNLSKKTYFLDSNHPDYTPVLVQYSDASDRFHPIIYTANEGTIDIQYNAIKQAIIGSFFVRLADELDAHHTSATGRFELPLL